MSKRKLAPADVIQQARRKLKLAIAVLVRVACLNGMNCDCGGHVREAEARVERAISVYTRTVRNAKCKR